MPLTDTDVERVASAVVSTLLGRSGPTVGVALQDTHNRLVRVEEAVAAIAQRISVSGVAASANGPVLTASDVRAQLVAALRSVQ